VSRHAVPRPSRGVPQLPTRKAPLLLIAAVAGALFAATPLSLGSAADQNIAADTPIAMLAPAQSGGIGSDAGLPVDGNGEAVARKELTEAEAESRLRVLAADRASRAAARAALAAPEFVLPTTGRLTSCFCMRWGTMHWGIDIAAPMMTPIYAAADGVVTEAGPASGYGNAIYLQHENGDVTVYGHMEVVAVQAGDLVSAGQLIANVGSRGFSTGPHLHFEVYVGGLDGERTDPVAWLAERGVTV